MLLAIEGIDGAGKCTQATLLLKKAKELGVSAEIVSFPRYGKTLFAQSIAEYLNGEFGDLSSVPPQLVSLLYAGDRFESLALVKQPGLVICDRYVASNLAYQAAKLDARQEFISWLAHIEYEVFGLPKADLTLYLDMPPAQALALIYQKKPRSYTRATTDMHERNTNYLARCQEVYKMLAATNFGSQWITIPCISSDGSLRPVEEIHEDIWSAVLAIKDLL